MVEEGIEQIDIQCWEREENFKGTPNPGVWGLTWFVNWPHDTQLVLRAKRLSTISLVPLPSVIQVGFHGGDG